MKKKLNAKIVFRLPCLDCLIKDTMHIEAALLIEAYLRNLVEASSLKFIDAA